MVEMTCPLCGHRADLAAFNASPSPLKGQFVLKCPTCCKTFVKKEAELPGPSGPSPRG